MNNRFFLVLAAAVLLLSACTASPAQVSTATVSEPTRVEVIPTPVLVDGYPVPDAGGYPEPDGQPMGSGPNLPTGTPDITLTPIIISDVLHNDQGEYIVLQNITDQNLNTLGFWLLNYEANVEFYLPEMQIPAKGTIKVFNGAGTIDAAEGVKWMDNPTLSATGDKLILLNKAGRAIWYYVYYPTQ